MDILIRLLFCGLAAFRLAEMLVIDDGIFDIFANLRGWFNKAPLNSKGLRRTIANGLQCVYCTGVWMSILLVPTFYITTPATDFILLTFAVAGVQSILAKRLGRSE